jgi:hypothetical protein
MIMIEQRRMLWITGVAAAVALPLGACGDSGGSVAAPSGGTVASLPAGATVQLADNNTDMLSVSANGSFAFADTVSSGRATT